MAGVAATLAVVAVMFVVGACAVPGVVYLVGKDLPRAVRGVLGRVLFVAGQLCYGGGVLVELPGGDYAMKYVYGDGDDAHIRHGGETFPVDTDHPAWSRLGLRPFAAGVLVTEDMADDVFVDRQAPTDGGVDIVDRNGVPVAVPTDGRLRAYLPAVYDRLGAVGGTAVADRVRELTMRKHGGDDQTSQLLFLGTFVLCLVLGMATGLLL